MRWDQQEEDYELDILQDSEAALSFIHEHRSGARKIKSCVILIDLYLPIYDGITILRAIRQVPTLEHIKVMVLTTLASPSQKIEIAGMGAFCRRKRSALNDILEIASEINGLVLFSAIPDFLDSREILAVEQMKLYMFGSSRG